MRRAMMRPMMSVAAPAAHGTTSVSECVGQSWAAAGTTEMAPKQIAVTAASVRIKNMVPHKCFPWRPESAAARARRRGMPSARGSAHRLRTRRPLLRFFYSVVVTHGDRFVFRFGSRGDASRQTRHCRVVVGVMKEYDRQAARSALGLFGWIGDAMQCREPAVIGPACHQVALIDDERARNHRHVMPVSLSIGDLQAADRVARLEDRDCALLRLRPGR